MALRNEIGTPSGGCTPSARDVRIAFGFALALWLAATIACLTVGNTIFPIAETPAAYAVTLGFGGLGAAILSWSCAQLYQRLTTFSFVHRATFVIALAGLGLGLDAILMTAAGLRYPLLDDARQRTIEMFMITAYAMYILAPMVTFATRRHPR